MSPPAWSAAAAAPRFLENVQDSPWPIFAGGVANQKRAALALGCAEADITTVMGRVLEPANGIPPVRAAAAAWQAHVQTGAEIDIGRLPIPTHSRGDGGAFITGGVIVSRDPASGRGNLSYNRMQRLGPHTFGFNVNEWRNVRAFMENRAQPEEPFPAAVAIGLDPAIMIAAGVRTEVDELTIAGAIRGQGVTVCRGAPSRSIFRRGRDRDRRADPDGHKRGGLASSTANHGEIWTARHLGHARVLARQPNLPDRSSRLVRARYIGNVLPRPLLLKFVRHINKSAVVHIPAYAKRFFGHRPITGRIRAS